MRRDNPILVVTSWTEVARLVVSELEGHPTLVLTASAAEPLLESEACGGMVIDVASDPTLCRRLIRSYLKHQPTGRIAVLSQFEDVTTLTAFAFRDGRLDLFFEPWDLKLMRAFLGLEAVVTSVS